MNLRLTIITKTSTVRFHIRIVLVISLPVVCAIVTCLSRPRARIDAVVTPPGAARRAPFVLVHSGHTLVGSHDPVAPANFARSIMSSSKRAPYAGESQLLLVSIDVGTTFTAASFCILNPGKVPEFVEASAPAEKRV
jgi:hypothetical protein